MSAPNGSTWDVTPQPARPGLADMQAVPLVDDTEYPPNPTTDPTSNLFNTIAKTVISIGKVVPHTVFSVTGGGAPSINAFTAAPSAPVLGTYTVVRNGAGDVSITWPANTFPSAAALPVASLNVALGAANYSIGVVAIANGVRVYTTQAAALTDLSFTVQLY